MTQVNIRWSFSMKRERLETTTAPIRQEQWSRALEQDHQGIVHNDHKGYGQAHSGREEKA